MNMAIKTPLTYYGGKQKMLKHILPLIPEHGLYTESFAGGAAVFWAKTPSPIEVLNDRNGEIANFYMVLQSQADELLKKIKQTPNSRLIHKYAKFIYDYPELFTQVERAWAVWAQCTMSFASEIGESYGYSKTPSGAGADIQSQKVANRKRQAADQLQAYIYRLEQVQIEQDDALKVISSRDSEQAFHYVDPPYINSFQGHYRGYTEKDFETLLECLSKVCGKFLLSCYDGELLQQYVKAHGWQQQHITQHVRASKAAPGVKRKTKVEVLTFNYREPAPLAQAQDLFQGCAWGEAPPEKS